MSTLTTHSVQIRQKVLSIPEEGTTDSTETLDVSEDMQLVITIKNPIGDPAPTAEDFGEDVVLDDTEDVTGERDAATIRTTRFYYDLPSGWVMSSTVRRYADASAPFPALPTNVFNIEFKDKRDTQQGYTQQYYWTEE